MMDADLQLLNDQWGKRAARVFPIPHAFPVPSDPWEWALGLAAKDTALVGTVMRGALEGVDSSDDRMVYASRGSAPEEVRVALIEGARDGAPVQLQVNRLREKAPEYGRFIDEVFAPTLRDACPFGYRMECVLFATRGPHTYNAHNDPGNNFLFQLAGKKKIKIWGPALRFYDQIVFDHDFRGKPELFEGPATEIELSAGQVLYFHHGALHEVSVDDGESSVSVAMRADAIYPLMAVKDDLLRMAGEPELCRLRDEFAHWDKFRASVFLPTRFRDALADERTRKEMPRELKEAILSALLPRDETARNRLPSLLDAWWADLCVRRNHCPTGALPIPPADRAAQLKQWEDERLKAKS